MERRTDASTSGSAGTSFFTLSGGNIRIFKTALSHLHVHELMITYNKHKRGYMMYIYITIASFSLLSRTLDLLGEQRLPTTSTTLPSSSSSGGIPSEFPPYPPRC
jgi:hypothetical protein